MWGQAILYKLSSQISMPQLPTARHPSPAHYSVPTLSQKQGEIPPAPTHTLVNSSGTLPVCFPSFARGE